MARLSDLPLQYRTFMKLYPYRSYDWSPGKRLEKPLGQSRLAVVTTAAFYLSSQPPFDKSIRGGDYSYRIIPADADLGEIRVGHKSASFDHSGIKRDPNLALPLDRLRELVEEGKIGSLAPRHFSFMGSITAPGRLVKLTAPQVAQLLKEDQVDAVFLTPA